MPSFLAFNLDVLQASCLRHRNYLTTTNPDIRKNFKNLKDSERGGLEVYIRYETAFELQEKKCWGNCIISPASRLSSIVIER